MPTKKSAKSTTAGRSSRLKAPVQGEGVEEEAAAAKAAADDPPGEEAGDGA
jgi:hypothetical protein